MTTFVFLTFALLGIGRNLPYQSLYFQGLGAADVSFVALAFLLMLDPVHRQGLREATGRLGMPIAATGLLSALAMASIAVNAYRFGIEGKDIFEVLKYAYLLVVMVVACHCTRVAGVAPAFGFAAGVIVSGIVALLNPMNPDVLGTPQIFNPNVIGNVLAVSVVLGAHMILQGAPARGIAVAIAAAAISFFTFSKGTWLMSVLGLLACYLALASLGHRKAGFAMRLGRRIGYVAIVALAFVVYEAWEVVSLIVEAKIAATDFEASAAEGGSFSARGGLILSAMYMFLDNPVTGVGISNYETVNNLLRGELGNAYYDDDNPNSAWFYVLACMGLPATVCFAAVFAFFVRRVSLLPALRPRVRTAFTVCVGLVFFIGGNVQLEMLTAYYYWVALGVVTAMSLPPFPLRRMSAPTLVAS